MENQLFDTVIKEMESTGTANDRYFLAGIEEVELKTIQAIAEAYAAKQSQKDHLVELMKMDEGDDGEPEYTEGICGDGAAILKDGVQMTVSEILNELKSNTILQTQTGEQCFTGNDIAGYLLAWFDKGGVMSEAKPMLDFLNLKSSQYATDRAKKALEKVLSMLRENQAASSQLVPEDAARSAQDIINETFVDLIEIVKTFKP